MTLPTFPYTSASTDAPLEGYSLDTMFANEIVVSRSGMEQRRLVYSTPRLAARGMTWPTENTATRVSALWDFYLARGGTAEAFAFFDFDTERTWTDVYVGAGTGAKTVFDLPSKVPSGKTVVVEVDGVVVTGTLVRGAGANGRDQWTADAAPGNGTTVTVTFTGQRFFVARFEEDVLSYRVFAATIYGGPGISVIEVKGEDA